MKMSLSRVLFISILCYPMITLAAEPVSKSYQLGESLYMNPGRGGCTQCHGKEGNFPVMPLYPKIGGQSEIYLYNQMIDYRENRRKNGLYIPMEVAMKPFSDEEIKAMAVYLNKQKVF